MIDRLDRLAKRRAVRGGAIAIAALVMALASRGAASAGDGSGTDVELLLEEGFFHETTLNDPAAAIDLYTRVLRTPGVSARDAAAAQLRTGICLHLQGRLEEAEREFRTVLERFASEPEAGRVAARYLRVGSRGHPARFMSPETIVYAEIVDLAGQVGFLSGLLRGSPLENPVDYYLSRAGRERPSTGELAPPRDDDLARLRAVLNLGFLKELQKMEGFALGFSSFSSDAAEYVGVFLPGTSDVSRGLIKAILTVAIEDVADDVEGTPVFRLRQDDPPPDGDPQDPFFIAMDSGEEVVFFGPSLDLVRGAIQRYRSPSALDTLAEVPDFQRALSARAGSSLFAYLRTPGLMDNLRRVVSGGDLAGLEALAALLDVERLESTTLTFSRSGDAVRLALRARVGDESDVWRAILSPPLTPDLFRLVPPEPLGFLAVSMPDLPQRARTIAGAVAERVPEVVEAVPLELRAILGLDAEAEERRPGAARLRDVAERVLSRLESLVVVQPRAVAGEQALSFCIGLRITTDAGEGARLIADLEQLLGALARAAFRTRASTEFFDDGRPRRFLGREVTPRVIEPVPGFRSGYVHLAEPLASGRQRHLVVVAPRLGALDAALAGDGEVDFPEDQELAGRSKILSLRPRDIDAVFGAFSGRPRNPLKTFLSRTPRVVVYTLESTRGLSLELTIPEAAPVLRELLRELPTRRPATGEEER